EAGDKAQRRGGEPGPPPAPLVELDRVDDGLGELAESVAEPHLVEGVNAAGLQPIAAEGARKVGVPLQQRDFYPAAGEQVGESGSGGPPPNQDDTCHPPNPTPLSPGMIAFPALLPNAQVHWAGAHRCSSIDRHRCAGSGATARWAARRQRPRRPQVSCPRAITRPQAPPSAAAGLS